MRWLGVLLVSAWVTALAFWLAVDSLEPPRIEVWPAPVATPR